MNHHPSNNTNALLSTSPTVNASPGPTVESDAKAGATSNDNEKKRPPKMIDVNFGTTNTTTKPPKKKKRKEDDDVNFGFPASLIFEKGKLAGGSQEKENNKENATSSNTTTPQVWHHHDAAAQYCAHHYEPLNQYRRLGIISRTLTGEISIPLRSSSKKALQVVPPPPIDSKPPTIGKAQAKKIAQHWNIWNSNKQSRNEGQLLVSNFF